MMLEFTPSSLDKLGNVARGELCPESTKDVTDVSRRMIRSSYTTIGLNVACTGAMILDGIRKGGVQNIFKTVKRKVPTSIFWKHVLRKWWMYHCKIKWVGTWPSVVHLRSSSSSIWKSHGPTLHSLVFNHTVVLLTTICEKAKLFDEEMEVLHVTQDGKFTGAQGPSVEGNSTKKWVLTLKVLEVKNWVVATQIFVIFQP